MKVPQLHSCGTFFGWEVWDRRAASTSPTGAMGPMFRSVGCPRCRFHLLPCSRFLLHSSQPSPVLEKPPHQEARRFTGAWCSLRGLVHTARRCVQTFYLLSDAGLACGVVRASMPRTAESLPASFALARLPCFARDYACPAVSRTRGPSAFRFPAENVQTVHTRNCRLLRRWCRLRFWLWWKAASSAKVSQCLQQTNE